MSRAAPKNAKRRLLAKPAPNETTKKTKHADASSTIVSGQLADASPLPNPVLPFGAVTAKAVTRDPLETEATTINELHRELLMLGLGMVERMIAIGGRLERIKEHLPHGYWQDWMKTHLKFDIRTAQRYLRVYKRRNDPLLKEDPVQFLAEIHGHRLTETALADTITEIPETTQRVVFQRTGEEPPLAETNKSSAEDSPASSEPDEIAALTNSIKSIESILSAAPSDQKEPHVSKAVSNQKEATLVESKKIDTKPRHKSIDSVIGDVLKYVGWSLDLLHGEEARFQALNFIVEALTKRQTSLADKLAIANEDSHHEIDLG